MMLVPGWQGDQDVVGDAKLGQRQAVGAGIAQSVAEFATRRRNLVGAGAQRGNLTIASFFKDGYGRLNVAAGKVAQKAAAAHGLQRLEMVRSQLTQPNSVGLLGKFEAPLILAHRMIGISNGLHHASLLDRLIGKLGLNSLGAAFEDIEYGYLLSDTLEPVRTAQQFLQKSRHLFGARLGSLRGITLGNDALDKDSAADGDDHQHRSNCRHRRPASAQKLAGSISPVVRSREHRLVLQISANVIGQSARRVVAPTGLGSQPLLDNGVEISLQRAGETSCRNAVFQISLRAKHGLAGGLPLAVTNSELKRDGVCGVDVVWTGIDHQLVEQHGE